MKKKFDEERKVKSIIKNKTTENFSKTGKEFSKGLNNNYNNEKMLNTNFSKNFIETLLFNSNKNSSNAKNEENSNFNFDSPIPNIKLNKQSHNSNKIYSMSDLRNNYSGINEKNTKALPKSLSSTLTTLDMRNNRTQRSSKTIMENSNYLQRNNSGNQQLKLNSNFNEIKIIKKESADNINVNFNMEDYFNLMNNYHNNCENSSTDVSTLNRYLGNQSENLNSNKSISAKSLQTFYESPYKRNNEEYTINHMRNLEILKKLAFKKEAKRIIYETEDPEY